ncbi:MAG: tripartite tricarboxylate transporter substrate binding protein [Betaproteobacteria bacterium]
MMVYQRYLQGLLCLMSAVWYAGLVQAQSDVYPNKPIKFIVGFVAGSATDTAARIIAERIRPQLGQQILVENRPGAASSIATEFVANAPNDGYILLFSSSSATVNAAAHDNATTQAYKSLVPIALVASIPNILVVNSNLGVKTVQEFIGLAKAKPGEISYASSGSGSSPHMSAELFESRAQIQMQHVPYKGSAQAMNDVLSGLVPVMFSPASSVLPHIRSGKLIALATTSNRRTPLIAVPTLEEAGIPNFNVSLWFGILAPKGTDSQIANKLSGVISKALDDPETRKLLAAQTMDIVKADPEEFKSFINSEIIRWNGLIKSNKINLN